MSRVETGHTRHFAAVGALLAGLVVLASCATTGVLGDFNLISIEEEWELGRRLEADIAKQLTLVNDQAALAYVNQVGRKLVAQTEMAQLPWKFHIVADEQVNAFNIPGGHVYVYTGLIAAADSAAELAGVMAHETAHGVARHATEQLTKSYGLSILAGVVLGQDPAVYERILAQVVGAGTLAKFSRDAEREADSLGVRFMHAAGYDPRGMASMFEELLERRRRRPGSVQRFFSSHPLTEERIADVRRDAAALPQRSGLIQDEPGFRDLRQRTARYN